MRRRIAQVALTALLCAMPATAALSPADLAGAGVNPPPNATMPSGTFVDQFGRKVLLTRTGVPTLLLFADFTCAHLCGPGITLTAGALHDAGLVPQRDYRLIVIGLDQDGPVAARALIAERLRSLPREAQAIQLLTGGPATVAAAETALGYHAVYDPAADQFAHSAASYVFAPDGRLSYMLPETALTPQKARDALREARAGAVASGSPIEQLVTLCYGLAAAHGVHGTAIVVALRIAGLLTIAAIGIAIWRMARRRKTLA